jgi:hypothetical protein
MGVVVGRWSLFGGGRQLRFDCIYESVSEYKILDILMDNINNVVQKTFDEENHVEETSIFYN